MLSYKKLLKEVAIRAKLTPEVVDIVLVAFTEVLGDLPVGEYARTPLGVFNMFYRKEKPVIHPVTGEPTTAPAEVVLKFRANNHTRWTVNSDGEKDSLQSQNT